jgi:hydroxypyruvate reductase
MTPAERIDAWFREVLRQLHPRRLTSRAISFESDDSMWGLFEPRPECELPVEIPGDGEVVVVAVGKAAIAMAEGAQDLLGSRFERGYVLTVDGPDASSLDNRWTVYRAGHPIPDQRGVDATRAIIDVVEGLEPDDIVVALISGGGSALFESPRPPLTLADLAELTRLLLNAGAPIQHLNAVRAPLSEVKGGSFRRRSPAGRFVTLILSDVLGNNPQIIASGPTVAPGSSGAAALAVLDLYQLRETVPPLIRDALNEVSTEEAEWDHPDDLVEIVGDNELAIELAAEVSRAAGFNTEVLDDPLEGEASEVAREFVGLLLETSNGIDVVWSGGETTVTVSGNGIGGRNTEFALSAALELDRLENDDWVVAGLATDGQDATTGSAGAIAGRETIVKARAVGLDPEAFLSNNDSATFFDRIGGLVTTGPTGTNVNDLYVGLRRRSSERESRETQGAGAKNGPALTRHLL